MEKQENKYCKNCYYPYSYYSKFCSNCGQKNTDGRITLKVLVTEFISTIFNLDSKTLLSLRDLFIPGRLTTEYFKGKHKRYVHPLRFFLVISVFFISAMLYFTKDNIQFLKSTDYVKEVEKDTYRKDFTLQLEQELDTIRAIYDAPLVDVALDDLYAKVETDICEIEDSISLKGNINIGSIRFENIKIARTDFINLSEQALADKYGPPDFLNRLGFQQQIKLNKNDKAYSRYIMGSIAWMILAMLPFLALFLKLFYIRRNRYYVEHLVFSFHTHTFVFFISTIAILINAKYNFEDTTEIVLIIIYGYLFLALKQVYQQSWGKTFLKLILVNFLYILLLIFFILLNLLVSLFLF